MLQRQEPEVEEGGQDAVQELLPKPEGFEPDSVMPYVELFTWGLDFATDAAQIATFVQQGDFWFAAICGVAIVLSTLCACVLSFVEIVEGQEPMTPWTAAHRSALAGRTLPPWYFVRMVESTVEAAVTGLVAPYGMLLADDLSTWSTASAALGLLLSVKGLAAEQYRATDCTGWVEAVAAVVGWRRLAAQVWRLVAMAAELSLFAVLCKVLHPAVALLLLLPSALAFAWQIWDTEDVAGKVLSATLQVGSWFSGGTSLLGLRPDPSVRRRAMAPGLAAAALRVLSAAWLLACLDLHQGVLPLGALGRPMGREVLHEEFLVPATAILKKGCWKTLAEAVTSWTPAPVGGMSTGSAIFRSLILCIAMMTSPVYLLGNLFLMTLHGRYRRGGVDEELDAQVVAKQGEIRRWCDQRLALALSAASEE